ncbi:MULTISPECIES: histidine--tRNA ligase [Aestuariimicrobium]|uniref:histidine--tRNA ligase n=1 Tax=Aestuariimicrobium TaxID=396388 RepID=UPI0003B5691B|nr:MULTISPECIES: histidine--tRNA ligase [Aestuariimicrobium]CAI9410051.1 Histidine--tRNA ligase [Aestuariimicrobium sp. T2.26MG-19.2B]
MARPQPLSGFPEYLPAQSAVEQQLITLLRETFELHGFGRIETRAVEPLEQLNRKGEITKEVYTVKRLHAAADDTAELGLHFDLTVPFARYVLENAGHLVFPFRRHQIQKVWRGERPQEGRYREFCQADIDVVGQDTLAAHHDSEVVLVALEAFEKMHTQLNLPPVLMRVNNRKLAQGFYDGLGVVDALAVIQRVDKIHKIGRDGVATLLADECGLTPDQIEPVLALAAIRSEDSSFVDRVLSLVADHPELDNDLLRTGLDELSALIALVARHFPGRAVADLSIARGLDYYTGAVFEIELVGYESLGTISAGGRYDALASDGKRTFPGVGISVGVTRILAPLLGRGVLTANRSVPSCVLVAVDSEDDRTVAVEVATALRSRGIPCEVAPKADKFGRQIRHADRRGIPYVWFGGANGQVKDIRSGDQVDASAAEWQPPSEDLFPRVIHPA